MLCGECRAGTVSPSEVSIDIDAWTMTPLVEDNAGNKAVLGFVCFKDMTLAAGNNLVSVWFIRGDGTSGPDGWKAKAWTSQDQWEAIAWLKNELAIEGESDENWGTKSAKPAQLSETPQAPSQYGGGVLEEDPVYTLIQGMANPGAVIQGLVSIGYPAADIKIETPFNPGCPFQPVLEAFSFGVEAEESNHDNVPGIGDAVIEATLAQTAPCAQQQCTKRKTAGRWQAWSAWSNPTSWSCCGTFRAAISNVRYCQYCRERTRTRTRTVTLRNSDCTTATCQQTQTQKQIDESTCGYQVAETDSCQHCPSASSACDSGAAFQSDRTETTINPPCDPY